MLTLAISPDGIVVLTQVLNNAQLTPDQRVELLCEIAHQHVRAGSPRDGLNTVKEAIEIAQQHQLPLAKAAALNAGAICYYARGDHLMAIACGIDAYIGFAAEHHHSGGGHALTTIAAACKDVNAFDLAEQALRGCMNIADRANDLFLCARAQNTLAELVGDMGRFDEAEKLLGDAMRNVGSNSQDHIAKITGNRCRLYKKRAADAIQRGEPDGAAEYLQEAIKLMLKGLASAAINSAHPDFATKAQSLGEFYYLMGERTVARQFFTDAFSLGKKLKHSLVVIESLLFLGRIARLENDLTDALRLLGDGLEQAKRHDIRNVQPKLHEAMADGLAAIGRQFEAEFHLTAARECSQRIAVANREVEREARAMWTTHLSRHPHINDI